MESIIKFNNIINEDDKIIKKVRQWRNKDRVRNCMINKHIISKEEHLKWFKRLSHNRKCIFWVVYIDKAPIGTINMQRIDYHNNTSEWGFYIGEDDYIGKGYGKQMLLKFLRMFFYELNFEKLNTEVIANNNIAIGLYKKLRFRSVKEEEGILFMEYEKKDFEILTKDGKI